MNERLTPELLAQCVDDVVERRETLAECLAKHPSLADDLRSLIGIAQAIPPLSEERPSEEFRIRGRAALIASIAQSSRSYNRPGLLGLSRFRQGTSLRPSLRFASPGLVAVIAAGLFLGGGGTAVITAQDSLPGDTLYPVKLAAEDVQVALSPSDDARANTYLDLASKRLAEIQKANERGR